MDGCDDPAARAIVRPPEEFMKKASSTKLRLTRTVVANLTPLELQELAGGRAANTVNMSVCFYQCCKSDYCGGSSGC